MNSLLLEALALCRANTPFALATILSQDGSTPRSSGSRMLILSDRIVSTIGGGAMEGEVIETARRQILGSRRSEVLFYDMNGTPAATLGLACGGSCEVLIADISPDYAPVFEAAASAERDETPAWLIYILDNGGKLPFSMCVNLNCETIVASSSAENRPVDAILLNPIRIAVHGESKEGLRYIAQDVGSAPHLFLFGAGHVSCEVAKLALNVGFRVTVLDDRDDYCNLARFPDCECIVTDTLSDFPQIRVDSRSYIVIMTRGHAHDREVLEWALRHEYKYLGMIGSKTKRDKLYQALMEEGTAAETLVAVHCPIGLSIFAETPAEIAVSVIAEIIAERRKER